MSNFDQFKKLQGELSQDMHLGSMEAENAKYVDSINGKLNTLKETWVSIGTTIVSSDFTKGLLDGAIKVSEAIDGIVKSLDGIGMLTPVITGFGLSFASMIKTIANGGKGTTLNIFDGLKKSLTESGTLMQRVGNVGRAAFATVGEKVASAGKYLVGFVAQGLAIAGITMLVQGLAKAWDHAANGLKNAEKEIKNSIEELQSGLNEDKATLKYLDDTSERYNELIKKKQEYSKVPVESWSEEQISDMNELKEITNELAQTFPELVIGYDSDGSPIMLMADDMEKLKERTKEQIELQNELLRIKREELADNARKQYQEGEFFGIGNGIKEDVEKNKALHSSLYDSYKNNEESYTQAVLDGDSKRAKKFKKTMDEQSKQLDFYYKDNLELYQEYSKKELEVQQSAFDQVQAIKGYDKLDDGKKSTVQSFMDNLNWVNMDEGQYNKWLSGFGEVVKMAETGNPKLKQWSDSLEVANEKFSATGNVESYNKTLSELAKTISKDLGIDYDTVFAGLETMGKPLSEAERQMNSFLESFGKTRYDLLNGDSIAMQLAEQFQGVSETVDRIFNDQNFQATGKINYDLMTEISNRDDIPDQIQSLASELAKGGVTQAESDLMLEIMMSIKSGDKEKIESSISDVNNKLKEMGLEEHTIDIKTLFDEAGTDKATTKVKDLKKELEGLPKNTKTLIENEVIGEEDIQTLKDLLGESSLPDKKVVQVLLDNQKAIADAGGLKQWLDSIPPETWAKLGIKQENVEEAKQNLDEVTEKQDEINGKESTIKVNGKETQAAVEDINSLIEHSSKLEDGTYNIDFKTNVGDTVSQLNSVRDAVNDISSAFGNIPNATIKVETAGAAKNISGLMDRVSQYKNATSGIKSITFKSNTAQSAKNITGLISKIRSYNTTASGVKALNFKANTAQAAKNITGLINKVNQYNRLKPKTITFNANTAQAAKNISGLINKINSVPTGTKTITYRINTVGSPPKSPTQRMAPEPKVRSIMPMSLPEENESNILSPIETRSISPLSESQPSVQAVNSRVRPAEVIPGLNHNVNLLDNLENKLKNITNQLEELSTKANKAFGQEKIGYLEKQNALLERQKQVQSELLENLRVQQNEYRYYLSTQGIKFDDLGNATNITNEILYMEGELDRLQKIAENAGEGSKDAADKRAKNYAENLDSLKRVYEAYKSLTFSEIPDAENAFNELNNSIKDNLESIKELKTQLKFADEGVAIGKYKNELGTLNKELELLESKLNILYGDNKKNALNEQINLLKKKQDELHNLANSYRAVQSQLKDYLTAQGFMFNSDGKVLNYDHLNDFLNTGKMKEMAEALEEYINLTNEEIPKLSGEWADVENAINKVKDTIDELNHQARLSPFLHSLEELGHSIDRVKDKMDLLDKMYENVYGKDKLAYYDKKISLMEQEKELIEDQYKEYLNLHHAMQGNLLQYGVQFDDSSLITNYDEVLNKFAGSKDYEKVKKYLDEYIKLVRDEIPDAWKNWLDLENKIKDAQKEKLETTKKIEDEITNIYKKQVEERKKLIDDELKKRLDALDKEKKAYNDARAEADYQDSYQKQVDVIKELEDKINTAAKDDSIGGKKKLQELLDQLKEEQEKLEDLVQDKVDKDINDMFDKESDRLEQEAEDAKDKLDKDFSDEKIKDLVKEALSTGVFEDIDGTMRSLQDVMIEFVDKYGDGMSAIGDIIKNEMITNLEIAKDTMKEISDIIKDLDLKEYSSKVGRMVMSDIPSVSGYSENKSLNNTIQFNSPLIHVDGNVDRNMIPVLEDMIDKAKNDIVDEIVSNIR